MHPEKTFPLTDNNTSRTELVIVVIIIIVTIVIVDRLCNSGFIPKCKTFEYVAWFLQKVLLMRMQR